MTQNWKPLLALLIAGAPLAMPVAARAELEQCGGIFLAAEANCEFKETQACMTQCVTVAVESSCVARIYPTCAASCNATATAECSSNCSQTCTQQCQTRTVSSTPPNCNGLCVSDCGKNCDAKCANSRNPGACRACCRHNCSKKCETQCQPQAMTVTECMPTCLNACSGSCTAQANVDCQISCQDNTYTQCEQTLVEQCRTECMQKGGAIFCDGQFLNAQNSQSCADELSKEIQIDLEIGTVLPSDTRVVVDSGCSVGQLGAAGGSLGSALMSALCGLALYMRRRRGS